MTEERVVNAFADAVRESWVKGYHDGFNGEELRHTFIGRDKSVVTLGDIYTLGHLAGREDAGDEAGWGGIRGLTVDPPEKIRQDECVDTEAGPVEEDTPGLILPKWIIGVSAGILAAQLAMWGYVLSRLP